LAGRAALLRRRACIRLDIMCLQRPSGAAVPLIFPSAEPKPGQKPDVERTRYLEILSRRPGEKGYTTLAFVCKVCILVRDERDVD